MSTPSDLQDVLRDLLLQGRFSDMEIICQGITFKAHQAIICTQSSYFNSAICGGFKESSEKAINIQEDNPETIERVLSFLYSREYNEDGHTVQYQPVTELAPPDPEDKLNDTEPKKIALNNMEVFIAADKFGIDPLKPLATQKFSQWATANWNSPVFPDVVQEVMTSVPSHELSLQGIIVDTISTHIFDLIVNPEFLHVLNTFGCLGSLVIAGLVQDGRMAFLRNSFGNSTVAATVEIV
ncbi:unnamed protein product [Penicillium glandicola]